jgi:hypothetical protein
MPPPLPGVDAIISLLVLNMSHLLIAIVALLFEHDLFRKPVRFSGSCSSALTDR